MVRKCSNPDSAAYLTMGKSLGLSEHTGLLASVQRGLGKNILVLQ